MEIQATDQPETKLENVEMKATGDSPNQAHSEPAAEKEAQDMPMDTNTDEVSVQAEHESQPFPEVKQESPLPNKLEVTGAIQAELEPSPAEPTLVEQVSGIIEMEAQQTMSDDEPVLSEPFREVKHPQQKIGTPVVTPASQLSAKRPSSLNSAPSVATPKSNALSMLAQYSSSGSDDDGVDDSVFRKPQSSSSSSSSSDSDDDILDIKVIEKKIREPVVSDDDSDDENPGRKTKKNPLKVKGELSIDDLPPIQDLQISVDARECIEIGVITTIVEQLVLVEAQFNSVPLDIDSVLFLDNGSRALGQIFDIIGRVCSPIYCVRFNNHDDIASKGITVGTKVFCAPRTEYTSFVILSNITNKGSDASWKNDIEPPDNLVEHSDDEQERAIKRRAKAFRNQPERREFVRGRRYLPSNGHSSTYNNGHSNMPNNSQQPNLAYPNYSWHQNLPQIGPQAYPTNYYPPPPPPQ